MLTKKNVMEAMEKVSQYIDGFEDYEPRIIESERLSIKSYLCWLLTEVSNETCEGNTCNDCYYEEVE